MNSQFWGLVLSLVISAAGVSNAKELSGGNDWTAEGLRCVGGDNTVVIRFRGGDQNPPSGEATIGVLTELLCWTIAHTDYDVPKKRPQVAFRSTAFFVEQICSSHIACIASGAYRDGSNMIVLHESHRDLGEVRSQAMLVHEIVHFLQDRSGRWADNSCKFWVAREREAYLLQFRYMIVEGGFPPAMLRIPSVSETSCAAS